MVSEERLEALRAQHKCPLYIHTVGDPDAPAAVVVFRKPPGSAFTEFQNLVTDDEKKSKRMQIVRNFVLAHVVHSEPLAPADLFEEYALIPSEILSEFTRLHSAKEAERAKKV